jgi:hypothetical protein
MEYSQVLMAHEKFKRVAGDAGSPGSRLNKFQNQVTCTFIQEQDAKQAVEAELTKTSHGSRAWFGIWYYGPQLDLS